MVKLVPADVAHDGYAISVSCMIEDPVHLREPATAEGKYRKSSDYEFVAESCDIETARRHLEFV